MTSLLDTMCRVLLLSLCMCTLTVESLQPPLTPASTAYVAQLFRHDNQYAGLASFHKHNGARFRFRSRVYHKYQRRPWFMLYDFNPGPTYPGERLPPPKDGLYGKFSWHSVSISVVLMLFLCLGAVVVAHQAEHLVQDKNDWTRGFKGEGPRKKKGKKTRRQQCLGGHQCSCPSCRNRLRRRTTMRNKRLMNCVPSSIQTRPLSYFLTPPGLPVQLNTCGVPWLSCLPPPPPPQKPRVVLQPTMAQPRPRILLPSQAALYEVSCSMKSYPCTHHSSVCFCGTNLHNHSYHHHHCHTQIPLAQSATGSVDKQGNTMKGSARLPYEMLVCVWSCRVSERGDEKRMKEMKERKKKGMHIYDSKGGK